MNFWVPTPQGACAHTITFSARLRGRSWSPATPIFRGKKGEKRSFSHMAKPEEDRSWQSQFYENWLRKMSAQEQLGLFPWLGPVMISGYFLYAPPKNWWPGKEKVSVPDDDNMLKQVCDALTPKAKGGYGAWIDDRQIIGRSSAKFYHPKGEAIVVTLYLFETVEKPRRGNKAQAKKD